jgi:thiol-disulfide isomerase/thioredoxin
MSPLAVGDAAPPVPGVTFDDGPVGLFFYKVTCPTCQLAAPTMMSFERAYPGRVVGIGQDPRDDLDRFTFEYAIGIRSVEDPPPYRASEAYAIESVPTLYLVGDGARVLDVVGAWDRDGFNRVSRRVAELTGVGSVQISSPADGLPEFKPG